MKKSQSRTESRRPTPTVSPKSTKTLKSPKQSTPLQLPKLKLKSSLALEDKEDFEQYVASIIQQMNGMLERLENIREFRID